MGKSVHYFNVCFLLCLGRRKLMKNLRFKILYIIALTALFLLPPSPFIWIVSAAENDAETAGKLY